MKGLIVSIFILLGVAVALASIRAKRATVNPDDTKKSFLDKAKTASGIYDIPKESKPLITRATPTSSAIIRLSGDSVAEYAHSRTN